MSAFFIILIILFICGWLTYRNAKANRRKRLEELKTQWGKPKKEHFPFHLIEQYSNVTDNHTVHELSAQTMADIDFHEVFSFVDRTVSKPGQQFLFYHFSETVKEGELYFDHQLKKGPLTTRNAIRILEMAGYPEEIIRKTKGYTA